MKVRFAPSPTGFLHIGGARTALFNWMYARAQGGKFVLRIEDTDLQRSKDEYVDEIMDSMKWLGFDWDELYYQSKRFDIYRDEANKLLDEGKAYKDGEAIILKIPEEEVKIYDLIRGEITYDSALIKDQVLMKSDGSPTYSFACVIDDSSMEITHVIRGEDHIPNTPKQIMIYNALGLKVPKYAHLPLIMGEDGARLSKRTGAVAVSDYRKDGFVAEALVNYLMLLGWAPGNNQEIISLQEAVKKFSIKKVNKAAAIFSMDKLHWINNQYLKKMDTKEVTELLVPRLKEKGFIDDDFDMSVLNKMVELYKGRLNTLNDFLDWANFVFIDQISIDDELRTKHLPSDRKKDFDALTEKFGSVEDFSEKEVEASFKQVVEELGYKPSDLIHPLRVALTGHAIGPSLFEIISVLGREKVLKRLGEAYQ